MDMVERVREALLAALKADDAAHAYIAPADNDRTIIDGDFDMNAVARSAIEAIEAEAVIVTPYQKVVWHGEGADEEYELVPTSRQQVYEQTIAELKSRLKRKDTW